MHSPPYAHPSVHLLAARGCPDPLKGPARAPRGSGAFFCVLLRYVVATLLLFVAIMFACYLLLICCIFCWGGSSPF